MSSLRFLRWTAIAIGLLLAILAAATAIVISAGITIDLDAIRGEIESVATKNLGREITIEGPIELTPTLWPVLQFEDLRIANPPSWGATDFARLETARVRPGIIPLLTGKIQIAELVAEGVEVFLEKMPDGRENWRFTTPDEAQNSVQISPDRDEFQALKLVEVKSLSWQRITIQYRDGGTDRVYELKLDELTGIAAADESLQLSARGSFQQQPYSLELTGGSLGDLLAPRQPWPIEMTATGANAELHLEGAIADPSGPGEINLKLHFIANRIGDLSSWLDVPASADMACSVRGELRLTEDELHLRSLEAQIGRTKLAGDLGWEAINTAPLLKASLKFATFDPAELQTIFVPEDSKKPDDEEEYLLIDMPIVPKYLAFDDGDIELTADLIYLKPVDVTNFSLAGRLRDGRMEPSPYQIQLGNTLFQGEFALDLRGEIPEVSFDVAADKADLGELFRTLQITDALNATADRLHVVISGRGETPRQLLQQSDFSAVLEGGHWTLDDPNLPGKTQIRIGKGSLEATAGKPMTLLLDGSIRKIPIKINLQGPAMAPLVDPPERLKLNLSAEAAGNRLELRGAVGLPIERSSKLALQVSLKGKRLNSLEKLLDTQLPPLGPYVLSGALSLIEDQYLLSDLDFVVGESDLRGRASLAIQGNRPRVDISLNAGRVQTNDFYQGLLPWEASQSVADASPNKTNATANTVAEWADLLDSEVLRSFDGRLAIQVRQVLSGRDALGGGNLTATLENGRLSLSPLELNAPSGSMKLRLALESTQTDLESKVWLQATRFDYGILARRIDPKTDMKGRISLDINLNSRDPDLENILANATGHYNFAVWPENFEAGIMDIWALNIFSALQPTLEGESGSKINCIVGRVAAKDGILDPKPLIIDTTKVRVLGNGRIDSKSDKIDLVLIPRIKESKLLTLDTPVLVQGAFDDFEIEVASADILKTTARLVFELYYLPLALLLKQGVGKLPADGNDLCTDPMKWTGDLLQ